MPLLIIDIYAHVWNIYIYMYIYSWFVFGVLSTVNLGRKFVGSLQLHIIDNNNEQYYLWLNSSSKE